MSNEKRNQFSIADRKRAVLMVIDHEESYESVARQLGTSSRLISRWVGAYRIHGDQGLSLKNKSGYSPDFKLRLLQECCNEKKLFLFVVSFRQILYIFVVPKRLIKTKLGKMSEELQIIQPNAITTAKYDYTAVQKNILYQMVGQLQDKMTNNKMNRDLFGSYIVQISIAEIAGQKNHAKVYEAAEELISKKFHYNWKKDNGREGKTTTALVASVTHEKNSRYLELKIPSEIVPILLYIGEGFTKYQKTIALTLKSVHAKRMYEICNRWRDLGAYRCSVDEFKEMMCLDDKYEKISMLKSRVLDAAKKELDESADVSFEYGLDKNGTRQFSLITFKIIEKKKVKQEYADAGLGTEDMVMVYNMLSIPYPTIKNGKALELSKIIAEHPESKLIYTRIASLRKELKEGKKKPEDLVKLLPHILKTDFGIV